MNQNDELFESVLSLPTPLLHYQLQQLAAENQPKNITEQETIETTDLDC